MAPDTAVHQELRLPNPIVSKDHQPPPPRLPMGFVFGHVSWLEVRRSPEGAIRYYLGAPTAWELGLTFNAFRRVFPGARLDAPAECPIAPSFRTSAFLLRGVPNPSHHYFPMQLLLGEDHGGLLVQSLSAHGLEGQEIVLQILFQRASTWERGVLSHGAQHHSVDLDPRSRAVVNARQAELPYHVEIRAALLGSNPRFAYDAIRPWLGTWSSSMGGAWWSFRDVKPRKQDEFYLALARHEIDAFAARKVRRDISATELSNVLPVPWMENHPELSYAGAPASRVPRELVAKFPGPLDLVAGYVDRDYVRLPRAWNHLAILGRTRSGKSTLAQNLVLQILESQPGAKVIVLEPTGNLIRDVKSKLPSGVHGDAVEIDPAHPTFVQDGVEMARVPLNLLHMPDRGGMDASEFERKAERLSGDLLQSIKNAWGEQSVGGRADFVLRAVLQGLLSVEGTNLVDAYSVLSDKELLRRLERLSSESLLRNALRVHLPRLDYSMTISSLDKVGKIATNPLLRKALCQRYQPVSFDKLLDHQLLLLNLGKDSLGTEGADFLGAIFLTQLWSALQERHRKDTPVYLVVDEFHNFAIPAFADMLSEGARLGLHVVAITQYLNRIPEKVRSAMIGNVDAWAFFPVGAEDTKDVYAIAQGAQHGWSLDHFTSGLGPHEVALATQGSLLKVSTYPIPRAPEAQGDPRGDFVRSSRRYARREDAEASPLSVSQEQVATFLGALPEREGRTREQLAKQLGWTLPEVDAAIALCKSTGDVTEGKQHDIMLERRGLYHRQALDAARNEGEEHCSLLADAATSLHASGIDVRIVRQGGGYLIPDGEFDYLGRTYSLEVECSTLGKAEGQVVKNVRKALADERRSLVVVSGRQDAARAVQIIREAIPHAKPWKGFGVVWPAANGELTAFNDGRRSPWPFLPGGQEAGPDEEEDEEEEPGEEGDPGYAPQLTVSNESDLALARKLAHELLAAGTEVATTSEFLERLPPGDGNQMDARRLGMALNSLGVPSQRFRRDGVRVREYDLRVLGASDEGPSGPQEAPAKRRRDSDDKQGSEGFAS